MRYRDTGGLHLDFHRTLNGTIAYLCKTFGEEFLDETFRRTARDVYRSIHEDLLGGDPAQLIEYWEYYFTREEGDFWIERTDDYVRLTVRRCPAVDYLRRRGIPIAPAFCRQTVVWNEAMAEGTPFEIATDVQGNGRCVQTIRRRTDDPK